MRVASRSSGWASSAAVLVTDSCAVSTPSTSSARSSMTVASASASANSARSDVPEASHPVGRSSGALCSPARCQASAGAPDHPSASTASSGKVRGASNELKVTAPVDDAASASRSTGSSARTPVQQPRSGRVDDDADAAGGQMDEFAHCRSRRKGRPPVSIRAGLRKVLLRDGDRRRLERVDGSPSGPSRSRRAGFRCPRPRP